MVSSVQGHVARATFLFIGAGAGVGFYYAAHAVGLGPYHAGGIASLPVLAAMVSAVRVATPRALPKEKIDEEQLVADLAEKMNTEVEQKLHSLNFGPWLGNLEVLSHRRVQDGRCVEIMLKTRPGLIREQKVTVVPLTHVIGKDLQSLATEIISTASPHTMRLRDF